MSESEGARKIWQLLDFASEVTKADETKSLVGHLKDTRFKYDQGYVRKLGEEFHQHKHTEAEVELYLALVRLARSFGQEEAFVRNLEILGTKTNKVREEDLLSGLRRRLGEHLDTLNMRDVCEEECRKFKDCPLAIAGGAKQILWCLQKQRETGLLRKNGGT